MWSYVGKGCDPMNYISINRFKSTPLYAQLKESIVAAIKQGILNPGDKLPTEEELCDYFGISRPVIRQAYAELINDGVVTRVKGRGTFIREKEVKSHFFHELSTFDDEMHRVGMTPETLVLKKGKKNYDKKIYEALNLTKDDEVYHLRLLHKGDGLPMCLVDTYLPLSFYPGIAEEDFEGMPLYTMLETKFNRYIALARRSVDAMIVKDEDAVLLHIAKGSAVHYVQTISTDQDDQVLELSFAIYPGDRNAFDIMIYKIDQ
ncbi:MAG TPA: GntR family transcriptional regulator [Erysipelotrichaceae bacterium]|nr:GntR family transcriptional regulator [Erysipelotrichaceae bacterium]